MENTHTYRTSIRWNEQRKASLSSPDLPSLEVATPPEFPGGHAGIWSPETLYVASAEACLMTTFLAIAENSKLEVGAYQSAAEGKLAKTDGGVLFTDITIRVKLTIPDASKSDRARRILERAEHHCLIANSMKTQIHLEAEVESGP